MSGPVFGIDLGQTTARIAWRRPSGDPGSVSIPAVVHFAGPEEVLVGDDALDIRGGEVERHVASVRDLLVRSADAGDSSGSVVHAFGRDHSPASIAARVLRELAVRAQAESGESVRDVVLALPAGSSLRVGSDLRKAATEAGFVARRPIAAPAAVSVHYGVVGNGVHRNFVVCDVGAGRLDITALVVQEFLIDIAGSASRLVSEPMADLVDAIRATGATVGGWALADLDAILLAGEGATPEFADAVGDALGVPVRRDSPGVAVASGAALSAGFAFLRINTSSTPSTSFGPPRATVATPSPEPVISEPDMLSQLPVIDDPEPASPQPAPELPPITQPDIPSAPAHGETQAPAPDHRHQEHLPALGLAQTSDGGAHPQPVAGLTVVRREHHALLTWVWPDRCIASVVRWRIGQGPDGDHGETTCARRVYEHEGGFPLKVGGAEGLFTVEALVPGSFPDGGPPSSVSLPALPPTVRYDLDVHGFGRRRVARVRLTSDAECAVPAIDVVLATGRYAPRGAHEGKVVHRIASGQLEAGVPLDIEFPMPSLPKGAWLVCFPSGPSGSVVDLLPVSLHRLKVR